MGQIIQKLKSVWSLFEGKKARIVMVGLDAAGKTTLLYKLKLDETVTTIPTIGFNAEEFKYKNISMLIWDLGGQDKIRPLWRYYFQNADAIIYVVDSNDRERIKEARDELHKVCSSDELRDAKVLVFANKQDLPYALNSREMIHALSLNELKQKHWFIQPCCATKGEGLFDGLEWLSQQL